MTERETIATKTITVPNGHEFRLGDTVLLMQEKPSLINRLKKMWSLLTKPRVQRIVECTPTTFTVAEMRPTWAEHRKLLWAALTT